MSVVPEEGRIVAVTTAELALNVVPSKSSKLVEFRDAVNVADVKSIVLENSRDVGMKEPGPKSPRLKERLELGVVRTSVLFCKVTLLNTGKSGGRAKPPVEGSPVKLLIVKLVTPGEPGMSGINVS